ncbi:hypothetical protein NF681_11530 [Comamonadaceae bacterium OTU4NAUVB1]|nr:hypothetical protein NF681_11530 [Comamonadaceae bacterium OTU4NAUVB1]
MSDNVSITPGTGAAVATDDVGGIHFQKMKLDVGGDGESKPLGQANPLPVNVIGVIALDAASLAALESIGVSNFPANQLVTLAGPVALDASALAALESITVQQSALPAGASTEATLAALLTALTSTPAVNTLAQPGAARQLTATTTGSGISTPLTARRISMVALGSAIRYSIGAGTQTAAPTSHYIGQGERLDLSVPAGAQIAVVSATPTAGVLELTELT